MNNKRWYILIIVGFLLIPVNLLVPDASGDEPPIESAAYHYWHAPENSMGISSVKSVNWGHFKDLFLAHTDWMLEYKRYSYSSWTDGSGYLTIDRTWNESGFWKFNLILNVPVHVYSARFTFGVDLQCLDYVEREGHEVWINYTANATETYSVMFNWSDIASIPGLVITKGVQGDVFWFRFRRDNIPAGYYEFDPTFGYSDDDDESLNSCEDSIKGMVVTCPSDGTVDNMSAKLQVGIASKTFRLALYDNTTNVLLGQTEEKIIPVATAWYTFNFSSGVPVNTTTDYLLCVWCNATDGTGGVRYKVLDNITCIDFETYAANYPNPTVKAVHETDRTIFIYCSYTVGVANNAPTITGEIPANQSTGISLTPQLNVTVDDADDDWLNVTWLSNSSNDWVWFAKNSSIDGATLPLSIVQTNSNFSTELTKYWWSVNVSDGTTWTNETYHFTTVAPWSNTAPTLTNEIPANTSTGITRWPQLNITVTDADGNNSEVYWYTNATEDDSWYLLQTNNSVLNETISLMNFTNASAYSTRYYWRVSANDSIDNTTEIYYFTIEAEAVLTLTNEYPTNGSNIFSVQPTLYFTLSSPLGDMSYSIYIGNTNITANYLLDSDSGLDNGTFHYVNFYNASATGETYWWRVHYNDSSIHVNDTFSFQPVIAGGGVGMGAGNVAIAMGVAGGVLGGLVGAMLFMRKRRRERY